MLSLPRCLPFFHPKEDFVGLSHCSQPESGANESFTVWVLGLKATLFEL